jgi:hypothetical protein
VSFVLRDGLYLDEQFRRGPRMSRPQVASVLGLAVVIALVALRLGRLL